MNESEWLRARAPAEGARDWIENVHRWCRATETSIWPVPESSALYHCPKHPPFLFHRGTPVPLSSPLIGIVGTRRPDPRSVGAAFHFARTLAARGLTIVSGLAQGIDGAAHRGALAASGKTVAVLGHGLDRVYPRNHEALARAIVAGPGCLLSEYPPGTPPLRHHFPERNRIIAGLVRGVLVIEAAKKSGSLITAQLALEEGRDVFVLPGNYNDENFVGSHELVKEGAVLVTSPEDILRAWDWNLSSPVFHVDCERARAKGWFIDGVATLGELITRSDAPAEMVLATIERGVAEGWLVETAAQTFAWIDD